MRIYKQDELIRLAQTLRSRNYTGCEIQDALRKAGRLKAEDLKDFVNAVRYGNEHYPVLTDGSDGSVRIPRKETRQ